MVKSVHMYVSVEPTGELSFWDEPQPGAQDIFFVVTPEDIRCSLGRDDTDLTRSLYERVKDNREI